MSQELRRRATAGTSVMQEEQQAEDPHAHMLGKGLSAPSMMQASPSHCGPAMKLHVPIFYHILPGFIQRILMYFCSFWTPKWKPRYLIQLGGYMYKFVHEESRTPKGSPLPVSEMDVRLLDDLSDVDGIDDYTYLPLAPDNCRGFFCVASIRKRHYYAVATREEAVVWVNTLRQAKQDGITRNMGHAKGQPYPYEYFDALAKSMVQSKERIRHSVQESQLREMELASMTGIAGSSGAPRGMFG